MFKFVFVGVPLKKKTKTVSSVRGLKINVGPVRFLSVCSPPTFYYGFVLLLYTLVFYGHKIYDALSIGVRNDIDALLFSM